MKWTGTAPKPGRLVLILAVFRWGFQTAPLSVFRLNGDRHDGHSAVLDADRLDDCLGDLGLPNGPT
jgi:hypothetical protein